MDGDCTRTLLITANVGSIFEEPETMFPGWLKSFFQCIHTHKPGILALHCQEVGGKNYEASMQHVNHFVKMLLSCEELHKYDRARIFLDEDYTAVDKFTALGNLYFIHEDVSDVLIWDFVDCKFVAVEGREVLSGNIENVPIKEKAKFPQHFFPEYKWSRKGFLRTRWSVNNCIFDLINIHLFHDASNIVAMESSPSLYAGNRQRALLHTLQRFENDKYSKVPLFIFGDFNFRLDSYMLIKELTSKLVASHTKGKKDIVNKIEYTEEGNGKIVLTVAIKNFDYYEKHTDLFASMNKWLHQYDAEVQAFRDRLFEYDIAFPPSYPFCEDVADGMSYMKTRVPSWCDRVLLTHSSKDILNQDPCHLPVYDLIGKDICMGDHKPVYLFVLMKPGKGNPPALSGGQDDVVVVVEPGKVVGTAAAPSQEDESPPLTPERRPRTLSINGERVITPLSTPGSNPQSAGSEGGLDWSLVNIHDYARFEQEKYLTPEFRSSIKKLEGEEEGGGDEAAGIRRKRSFKEMASKVRTMEKVLKLWPRRPKSRHHSSSSEDFSQSESEAGSSRGKPAYLTVSDVDGRASETTSVDTVSVDLSPYRDPLGEEDKPEKLSNNNNNNNNTESLGLKDNLKGEGKDSPADIKISFVPGDEGNVKTSSIDFIVNGEEGRAKGNGMADTVLHSGLVAGSGGRGKGVAPSDGAAGDATFPADCVGDAAVLDVVAPMHEGPAGPVVVSPHRGSHGQGEEGQETGPETRDQVKPDATRPSTAPSGTPPPAAAAAASSPSSSLCRCGCCRCVVL